MDFFEAVRRRRSIRSYTEEKVPEQVVQRAIEAAVLAPNSSNMQTWRFFWVQSAEPKKALVEACLSQGAARTAAELVVFVADPSTWPISQRAIVDSIKDNPRKDLQIYYKKLVPFFYSFRFLAPLKWLLFNAVGLFRPFTRKPWSGRDIQEVCIKSCALAAENFMLAIAAQVFDSCPMEGFDEVRVKRILRLGWRARVVMVVSVGRGHERGLWGPQYRMPLSEVFKII